MDDLLSMDTLASYLVERGLVAEGTWVGARELSGGISNIVLAVRANGLDAVLKQSLPKLRVADDWPAKRERAITEAEALRLAGRLTPRFVPEVLDVDEDRCVIVIAHAPGGWSNWKDDLLAGSADPGVAGRLGRVLAVWHDGSRDSEAVASRFNDMEAFDQLRVDPYHRTVMRRRPELAGAVGDYVERMLLRRRCLVHGDYSPKNVLVGAGDQFWIVDFEVAHFGDPVFDVAFMLNHLMLKAIHRPSGREGYRRCAAAFWDSYRAGVPERFCGDVPYVNGHVGCLMVARVDGKSPAEYLTHSGQTVARDLGSSLVLDPPGTLEDAWALIP